ncbi:MAG: S1 RNA-binding domain-containing protein, partial [Rudaea sp.]
SVKIDVEEDGTVFVSAINGTGTVQALEKIRAMTESPKIGNIYTGKVVRITDFGAFVEIAPGVDGMVHRSQLADYPVNDVRDVVKEGDEVMVMITDIDSQGKIRLSRTAVLEGWSVEQARERDNRLGGGGGASRGGDRGPRRDGGRGGDRGPRGSDRGGRPPSRGGDRGPGRPDRPRR